MQPGGRCSQDQHAQWMQWWLRGSDFEANSKRSKSSPSTASRAQTSTALGSQRSVVIACATPQPKRTHCDHPLRRRRWIDQDYKAHADTVSNVGRNG
eukprot:m.473736 g.473736  ORF g.473736 m.473736 type:complete len:97 (+) comp34903_c0_seq1:1595-1885(+)